MEIYCSHLHEKIEKNKMDSDMKGKLLHLVVVIY